MELWHRQPDESSKDFHAFMLYRDMTPKGRSLREVCQKLTKSLPYLTHLKKWSSHYNWVARVQAYDDHLAAARAEAQEKAIIEMAERQAKEGMTLQIVGIKRFLDSEGKVREEVATKMKDGDAIRAVEVGVKIERMARGEPTEIVKGEIGIKPMAEYSDQELWAMLVRIKTLKEGEG